MTPHRIRCCHRWYPRGDRGGARTKRAFRFDREMIRDDLAAMVETAARDAMAAGELPQVVVPEALIERPARPEHGDYATSMPLRLGRASKANPVEIAKKIAARIDI